MNPRHRAKILAIVGFATATVCLAPFIGPTLPADAADFIFWRLRVPRVLMAIVVGSTLSLVGAAYQTLFANPLATPSTIGTTAGAALGALIAIICGVSDTVWGIGAVTAAALLGALGLSVAATVVAASGRARMNDIVLSGVACSLAAGSLSAGLQYAADPSAAAAAVRWSLGHLPHVGFRGPVFILPFAAVTAFALLMLPRALDALALGEDVATTRGVNVPLVRSIVIGCGALGVAACVAWCGPIAFVELIVPHFVRLAVGPDRRTMLPMTMVVGAAFLTVCDTAARSIMPGREIPVGVLTAALGAPMLVYLLVHDRR